MSRPTTGERHRGKIQMDFRRCNLLVVRPQETNISVHYAASRSSEANISGGTSNLVSRPYIGSNLIAAPLLTARTLRR
jgi:hypothetical protein